jgi:AAA+ ATPase superfamily predicted ATPase
MKFMNRQNERARLDALAARGKAGFAAIWGRRRVGKSRLLTEWCRQRDGLYTVADASAAPVQRRYFAEAVGARLPGFAESEYPDWKALLRRLAQDAKAAGWRGPLVVDEFPYWVKADSSLPGILQNWVDEQARSGGLVLVIAGSSQRMMQGMLLDRAAPLYGRAAELMALDPLPAGWIGAALGVKDGCKQVEAYAAWGGIPRYWELAEPFGEDVDAAVDALVLDPLGALHSEPDRLLMEETPPATALRPLLDVIGGGAHRLSEIAGRLGLPATALARPMGRLVDLGLVGRETPFGVAEKNSKRSLYVLDDPFCRFWFRVVAPNRGLLVQAGQDVRLTVWRRQREQLFAAAWEDLCRRYVGRNVGQVAALADGAGFWLPAKRWWRGSDPEWDVVSVTDAGTLALLGEVKWSHTPFTSAELERIRSALVARARPSGLPDSARPVVFVPRVAPAARARVSDLTVVDADEVMAGLK